MDMGALSSLAEVGVGLNLALSLIKGIRERFIDLFKINIEKKRDSIKAGLNEAALRDENDGLSEIIVKLDDISDDCDRHTQIAYKSFIFMSLFSALSLIYFLYESAKAPQQAIPDYWAELTLAFAILPISLALITNYCIYFAAKIRLNRRDNIYKELPDLLKKKISPTVP